MLARTLLALAVLLLAGCASSGSSGGRYAQRHDAYPATAPDVSSVQNATVTDEPYSKQGNKDYRLRGQSYSIIRHPIGFTQVGYASWYGTKFHGYHTANGETYDMYAMTAAHKRLPLPSFVRVTNLANGKQVVVRVNDRGPFHPGRIIDLSYAAAYKLDMLKSGTAKVRIEVVSAPEKETVLAPIKAQRPIFVQVIASRDRQRANALGSRYADLVHSRYQLSEQDGLYKVQLGPLKDELAAEHLIEKLKSLGIGKPFKVYAEPQSTTGVNNP